MIMPIKKDRFLCKYWRHFFNLTSGTEVIVTSESWHLIYNVSSLMDNTK